MAIYQFVIELIPSEWVAKNKIEAIKLLCDDLMEHDTSIAWESFSLPSEFDSLVAEILLPGKSWSKNIKLWGDEKRHDIQLWIEGGVIESIQIRLDLRDNIDELKIKLIDFINKIDCDLFIPESQNIIRADIDELNKAIVKSRAYKFVCDPKGFLNKLSGIV